MLEVKISGDLIAQWLAGGSASVPEEITQNLPRGCDLVDGEVDRPEQGDPVLRLFFDDADVEYTETERAPSMKQ